jgi:DNA-directed RNA polymerase subunit omega
MAANRGMATPVGFLTRCAEAGTMPGLSAGVRDLDNMRGQKARKHRSIQVLLQLVDARNRLTRGRLLPTFTVPFFVAMLGSRFSTLPLSTNSPAILQFPAEPTRAVHSLRIMTTQLLQEAAQVIPNPQLLINVVSKRVRQLGLGHRPMVEVGPRASLTDIALKEIIAGKLAFEEQSASTDGA